MATPVSLVSWDSFSRKSRICSALAACLAAMLMYLAMSLPLSWCADASGARRVFVRPPATAPPGSPLHFVDAELTGKQGGRAPLHPVPPLHTAVIGADLDPPSRPQLPPQNVFHHAVCFFQRIVHLTLAVRAQGLGTAVHGRGRVVPVVLGTALGALHDSAVVQNLVHVHLGAVRAHGLSVCPVCLLDRGRLHLLVQIQFAYQ